MSFSVSYNYIINDLYSGKLAKIRKATDKFNKTADRASKKAKRLGNKLTGMSSSFSGLAGTVATGAAVIFPVNKAIAFESQMANVKKVLNNITPKEFADLQEVIKSSAEQLGRIPVAVGEIAEAAGKTGVPVGEMKEFIELVAKTAISFDMLDGVAGSNLGQLRTRLKLSVGGVNELMDSVNFMADNTSAGGERMIEIIGRLSGDFLSIKMPTQLIAGWAAFADQIEVTPQLAASGLRQLLQRMKKKGLGEALLADPSAAIRAFLKKFEKIPAGKRGKVLIKELGTEAAKFAEKAVEQLDLLDSTLKKSTGADQFGSMTRELVVKTETAAFKLAQMKAMLDNLAIDFGMPMLKVIKALTAPLKRLTGKFRDFVKLHPDMSRMMLMIMAMVAVIVPLTLVAGMLATAIGALLSPIGAVIAVIILFMGAVGALAVNNEGLRSALVNLWDAVQPLIEPFKMLFDLFGGGEGIGDALAAVIHGLAAAIRFILSPLKAVLELGKGLASGDFIGGIKGAYNAMKEGSAGLMPSFGGGSGKNNFVDTRVAAGAMKGSTSTLNGSIRVSAAPGSKVESTDMMSSMHGNLGMNTAGATS